MKPARRRFGVASAVAPALLGVAVLAGWACGVEMLTRFRAEWVTMRVYTATCFILSGGAALAMTGSHFPKGHLSRVDCAALYGFSACLIVLTLATASPSMEGGVTYVVTPNGFVERPLRSGVPSLGTVGAFLLIAGTSLFAAIFRRVPLLPLVIVEAMGWIALLGYLFGVREMHYYVDGVSASMAAHAAVGFILLGRSRMGMACTTKSGRL